MVDEPTSAEWVIGEWVTLDRELHPFEALELATVIEAVKLHMLHGWPRWWAWTFASLVAQIAIGIFATQRISPHTLRHTTAMHLLQSGVDITVIALWLGHEDTATTHQYVEADLAMKEAALRCVDDPAPQPLRFTATDRLLDFLEAL